jgi:hypothetical protein
LHNELLERDLFLRNYKEESRILYDEREWRSLYIKTMPAKSLMDHERKFDLYFDQGYLPTEYNLKFAPNDVVAILTENKRCKNELIHYLRSTETIIEYQNKIFDINEYKETIE